MQVNQEDRIVPQEKSSGNSGIAIILLVSVLLIAGGAYYYFSGEQEPRLNSPNPLPANRCKPKSRCLNLKPYPSQNLRWFSPKPSRNNLCHHWLKVMNMFMKRP